MSADWGDFGGKNENAIEEDPELYNEATAHSLQWQCPECNHVNQYRYYETYEYLSQSNNGIAEITEECQKCGEEFNITCYGRYSWHCDGESFEFEKVKK